MKRPAGAARLAPATRSDEGAFLTVREVAAKARVSTTTITRWVAEGCPAIDAGTGPEKRKLLFRWPAVEAWLAARSEARLRDWSRFARARAQRGNGTA